VHTYLIPAIQEVEVGESQSKAGLGKSTRPYLKNKLKAKRTGLWLKHKALNSTPSTTKKA
jgi:hypothetical protein